MTDNNSSEESIFISYLESKNLYGWEMSKCLLFGGFDWFSQEEIKNFNVNSISENRLYGYTLEVDLEYHDGLHDFHNDYPLYP